jgi:hypothetical protein
MNDTIKTKPPVLPGKRIRQTASVISQAEKTILSRRAKKDTPPEEEKTETAKSEKTDTQKANAEYARLAKELDKIFTANNFRGVVRAPADLMLAASGRKIWDIPDKEIDSLAETGALAAKGFVKTDARWVAVILFSMSLLTTYGGRAGMHIREVREEKKKARRNPAPINSGNAERVE